MSVLSTPTFVQHFISCSTFALAPRFVRQHSLSGWLLGAWLVEAKTHGCYDLGSVDSQWCLLGGNLTSAPAGAIHTSKFWLDVPDGSSLGGPLAGAVCLVTSVYDKSIRKFSSKTFCYFLVLCIPHKNQR